MNDNIKFPPMPKAHTVVKPKNSEPFGLITTRDALNFAAEAVRLNAQAVPDGLKEKLTDLLADGLRGTWHCNRVWGAWHVGTMSEDDFEPVEESDTPAELADAVIAMLSAAPQPAQPLTDEQIYGLYRRAGLDAYHLRDDIVLRTYDRCINDFVRAIERAHGIGGKND